MKKVIMILMLVLSLPVLSFCDIQDDMGLAYSLFTNHQYVASQAAYEKIIQDYPLAHSGILMNAQFGVGQSLSRQNKIEEALTAYEKIISDYPVLDEYVKFFSQIQLGIGNFLLCLGKTDESQLAFIKAATGYGFISLDWQNKIMGMINPAFLNEDQYTDYLRKLLMIVPATEENAAFLGKVKSQLEVLK